MPLILSGNVASAVAGAYEVANSCRWNGADDPSMLKTSVSGNTKTFTVSLWLKRSKLGAFTAYYNQITDNNNYFMMNFQGGDELDIHSLSGGANQIFFRTNAKFRDISAWMNIVCACDTTQATEGNRFKIWVNGTQQTSFSYDTYPDQNADVQINIADEKTRVGAGYDTANNHFNGYIAEVCSIDGTAYSNTDFGEFDEDSPTIWKPKDVSGLTFGNNGFYLDFEDSANLGNDANGGTDLTETNLAATDQTTDTPTNNFATWNPLDNYYSAATFTEGNVVQQGSDTPNTATVSTIGMSAGKWYCEVKPIAVSNAGDVHFIIGVMSTAITANNETPPGYNANDYGYYGYSGQSRNNNSLSSYGDAYALNDIIGIALNLDDNELKFYKNGTVQNSGTAISITAAASTPLGAYFFAAAIWQNSENGTFVLNTGNPSYANTSDAADENGYGAFEYAPPSGFLALCTKNLGSDGG